LNDLATVPNLSQVSISFGTGESQWPASTIQVYAQAFAQLAAQGVTVLAASGDGGSNPNTNGTNGYNPANPLEVEYPASDPNVTGVGGTVLSLNPDSTISSESAWSYSGGGLSKVFTRPAWQSGAGVPATPASGPAMRCVPDVAAVAANSGTFFSSVGNVTTTQEQSSFIILNGAPMGVEGTSLATPVWAGICARLNQLRVQFSLGPMGLLGPKLYPASGTNAFNDINAGSNGAYNAGPMYDLCSGLGSPNLTNLLPVLVPLPLTAPQITAQPVSQTVNAGAVVTLAVTAFGFPTPTYQWYFDGQPMLNAAGGATGAEFTISNVRGDRSGDFFVVVSNALSSVQSDVATITLVGSSAPQITTQPVNQTVKSGDKATFSVAASGDPSPNYEWQLRTDEGNTWVNLTNTATYGGTATGVLTVAGVTAAMNGYQYRCVAINGAHPNAMSSAATLTLGLTDQVFLQLLFQDVLGRSIDLGGAASYGAALAGGGSRTAILGNLLASTEYGAWQIEPAIRLYYAALARMPDYAGLLNWSANLHAGALTLTGAADQFAGSAEFLLKYGSLDNTGYVQQLYRNVLGREADPAGLADWVGQLNGGASRGTILVGFSESPEFQADMANLVEIVRLYYLLKQRMPTAAELQSWLGFLQGYDQTETLLAQGYPSGLADSAYLQLVFQGFLRRPVDPGALSTYGSALTAGTVTYGSLVNTLLDSTEFSQFVGPVSRLYMAAFHRVPDAGGLDNWVAYVRGGNPLQSAADAFVASQEFQLTYGSVNDTQYVTLLYENVLGREPDPAGLADWVAHLGANSTRGQVLIGFSESPEGIRLFAPTVRTFLHYFTFLNTTPAQSDLDYWRNYLATLDDQMRETFLDGLGASN
jgi:hypothetical protein